jgi:hypothetical protein
MDLIRAKIKFYFNLISRVFTYLRTYSSRPWVSAKILTHENEYEISRTHENEMRLLEMVRKCVENILL